VGALVTWSSDDISDLTGRRVLVTGANSGIGFEAARMLAGAGATVVLGCRDLAKGESAAERIRAGHPGADVDVLVCDLADLASVEQAARAYAASAASLDVLVNNAGVMALPYRQTADGFEMQLGTNHLGHFALTGRLLDCLLAAPAPRVVTVSSGMHWLGRIDFANLDGSRGYEKWRAYAQSKLANLLFTFELQRRARAGGLDLLAAAAHPGYAATHLQARGPAMAGRVRLARAWSLVNRAFAQDAATGALPTVRAAADPQVSGGDYYGPLLEARGAPRRTVASPAARSAEVAARLWQVSEELTGVRYLS
jgi:NAD(P)-dependent dehydrogenase (short-subunit alcohol dehydrogenase family)